MRFIESITLSLLSVVPAGASVVMPHHAFLSHPVHSTKQLLSELQQDATVRHRYERHFRMSEPELTKYFSALHLEALKAPTKVRVYSVDSNFVIKSHIGHLKAGMLVFVDASYKPILQRSCGNPLVGSLPALGKEVASVHSLVAKLVSVKSSQDSDNQEALLADESGAAGGVAPGDPTSPLVADSTTTTAIGGPSLSGSEAPLTSSAPTNYNTISSPSGGLIGLGAIATGAGLFAIFDHGHTHTQPQHTPVPELASLAPFSIGLLGVLLRRRRKTTYNLTHVCDLLPSRSGPLHTG